MGVVCLYCFLVYLIAQLLLISHDRGHILHNQSQLSFVACEIVDHLQLELKVLCILVHVQISNALFYQRQFAPAEEPFL